MLGNMCRESFQFTPLREGRRHLETLRVAPPYFNSRPSARGDEAAAGEQQTQEFQFTPLREGRLAFIALLVGARRISIHAPPRGATTTGTGDSERALFQFTPLREGRRGFART